MWIKSRNGHGNTILQVPFFTTGRKQISDDQMFQVTNSLFVFD